jgi:hypothetical protein
MLESIQSAIDFVNHNLMSSVTVVGLVLEMAMRLIKSEKPLSFAHAVSAIIHKIGDLCAGIANFLDKVLPQNLK